MTSTFDASGDLAAIADHLEPVTLRRRSGGAAVAVQHALRRAVLTREVEQSGGKLAVGDLAWHLPMDELQPAPQPGDAILAADARRWTILELVESPLSLRWRAVCRDLALAHGLRDVIRVQRAVWHKGSSGAIAVTWRDQQFGIAARIVPSSTERQVVHERGLLPSTWTVLLADSIEMVGRQRIVDSTGQAYDILRYEPADRVELPHVLHVRRSE